MSTRPPPQRTALILTPPWHLVHCPAPLQIDFLPFDPTIKRTEGTLRGPDGKVFKTTKGAPHIILKLIEVRRL